VAQARVHSLPINNYVLDRGFPVGVQEEARQMVGFLNYKDHLGLLRLTKMVQLHR